MAQANKQTRPHWDSVRRELSFGDRLVKRFALPAPNQIAIIEAFQEEGWPERIDDPLTNNGNGEVHPKRRLNDTVKRLNRCQAVELLHFSCDGTGEGVYWQARFAREDPAGTESRVCTGSNFPAAYVVIPWHCPKGRVICCCQDAGESTGPALYQPEPTQPPEHRGESA